MLAEVKVLLEGFLSNDFGDEKTQPTISLVTDGDVIMIVDPGTLESRQILIEKIMDAGFEVDDINYVFITHSHIDHYKNIGMFPNAKVLEFFGVWEDNKVTDYMDDFTENIKILKTPGHNDTSLTLLVSTDQGKVAICGDVFWKENKPEVDTYAQDLKKLQESRKLVQDMADFIIPGHGPMYKVTKEPDNSKTTLRAIPPVISIFANLKEKLVAKDLGVCRNCRKPFKKEEDKCICSSWLCYHCCECDDNCDLCSCSHKI